MRSSGADLAEAASSRRSIILPPPAADRAVGRDAAGLAPAAVDLDELAGRGDQRPVQTSAPAGDASVVTKGAGKVVTRGDLLEGEGMPVP